MDTNKLANDLAAQGLTFEDYKRMKGDFRDPASPGRREQDRRNQALFDSLVKGHVNILAACNAKDDYIRKQANHIYSQGKALRELVEFLELRGYNLPDVQQMIAIAEHALRKDY